MIIFKYVGNYDIRQAGSNYILNFILLIIKYNNNDDDDNNNNN